MNVGLESLFHGVMMNAGGKKKEQQEVTAAIVDDQTWKLHFLLEWTLYCVTGDNGNRSQKSEFILRMLWNSCPL